MSQLDLDLESDDVSDVAESCIHSFLNVVDHFKRALLSSDSLRVHRILRMPFDGGFAREGAVEFMSPGSVGQAKRWAIEALSSMYYAETQGPNETLRVAGVVEADESVLALARQVNESRAAVKKAIKKVPNKKGRSEVYKRFSTLCSHQLRRKISLVTKPAHFSFRTEIGTSVDRISVDELRVSLAERRSLIGMDVSNIDDIDELALSELEYSLLQDAKALIGLSASELIAEVRPVRPHLRVNVNYGKRRSGDDTLGRYVNASMPVLVQHGCVDSISFTGVDDNQVMWEQERPLSERLIGEPLLMYRPIYRYKPEYREHINNA